MQNIVLKVNIYLTFMSSIIFNTFEAKKPTTMAQSTSKINIFTFFKLPAAWWCGVRMKSMDHQRAVVTVKYRWINQNPFKSMYWAVQGMAAELSTGAMVTDQIRASGEKISMLVANNTANFSKKARGAYHLHLYRWPSYKRCFAKNPLKLGRGKPFG